MENHLTNAKNYICRYCRSHNDIWVKFCPACGRGPGAMLLQGTTRTHRPKAEVITALGRQPKEDVPRLSTGLTNLDEMFGGRPGKFGLAVGSVIQLAGPPGIGKSTLLAQIAAYLKGQCLYVTSEESKRQLANRMRRVAGDVAANNVEAISTIDDGLGLGAVCKAMRTHPARVIIIDSLQGLRKDSISLTEDEPQQQNAPEEDILRRSRKLRREMRLTLRAATKHSQLAVRDIALDLIREAKRRKLTMIVTGHLTKNNDLAGLREIEHMVDVVAWFKGDPGKSLRTMSCSKNREGDTMVSCSFDMTEHGLAPRIFNPATATATKIGDIPLGSESEEPAKPIGPKLSKPGLHLRLLPKDEVRKPVDDNGPKPDQE